MNLVAGGHEIVCNVCLTHSIIEYSGKFYFLVITDNKKPNNILYIYIVEFYLLSRAHENETYVPHLIN